MSEPNHPGTTVTSSDEAAAPTPEEWGVGARFSVAVMHTNYAAILLDALREADTARVQISTDDVSTHVGGTEADVLRYVTTVIAGAARSGAHVSASVLLSRGCPGEVTCALPVGGRPPVVDPPRPDRTGVHAAAHWSLYPMADTVAADDARPDHMRDIEAAIAYAREVGTYRASTHFATRLEGDLADVLATVAAGWVLVGRTVQHVTTHVTLSLNSPTPPPSTPAPAVSGPTA